MRDGRGPVTLAQPRMIGTQDCGQVGELGQRAAERLVDQDLLRGV